MLRSLILIAALAAGTAHAGTAQVQFTDPDRYADADRSGFGRTERQRTLDGIERQFKTLAARHLGADQTLAVEVLDIDLAGELRMVRGGRDTRVLNGGADIPRLEFRYRLQRGDTLLASGQERLSELDYLRPTAHPARHNEPLAHEQRMLERWFAERFDAGSKRQ
jgi:hypothetical protein